MASVNDTILEVKAIRFREQLGLGSCDPVPIYEILSELKIS